MDVGDIVELKSGGPRMTVSRGLEESRLMCMWFDGATLRSDIFPLGVLKGCANTPTSSTPEAFPERCNPCRLVTLGVLDWESDEYVHTCGRTAEEIRAKMPKRAT